MVKVAYVHVDEGGMYFVVSGFTNLPGEVLTDQGWH